MWQSVHDTWWRLAAQSRPHTLSDAFACNLLSTGAIAYRAVIGLRNLAFDRGWARSIRLPVRVVSVGNLTVGGTGKTACVGLVTKRLMRSGRRVAVLSRGYGGSPRACWLRWERNALIVNGTAQAARHNGLADEPQLLARHLEGVPIIIGPKRTHSGRLACEQFGVDTLVLDDAFQHRQLARDCDIVLIHARMPLGGWALLPRGPMREPLSALRRADVVMITKADEAFNTLGALRERLQALNPSATLVTAVHEPDTLLDVATGSSEAPSRLHGARVGLLSSIGDPEGFEATVRRLHATVAWHRAFPDHYRYQAADWNTLIAPGQGVRPDAIVTTEKDWIRLQPWIGDRQSEIAPLWVLKVRMKILDGEEALNDRLARLYAC